MIQVTIWTWISLQLMGKTCFVLFSDEGPDIKLNPFLNSCRVTAFVLAQAETNNKNDSLEHLPCWFILISGCGDVKLSDFPWCFADAEQVNKQRLDTLWRFHTPSLEQGSNRVSSWSSPRSHFSALGFVWMAAKCGFEIVTMKSFRAELNAFLSILS